MKYINIFLISIVVALSGCSVSKVSKLPSKKDMTVMAEGEHRMAIITEFGQPIHTEQVAGKTVDTYSFVKGHSAGAKFARGVTYGAVGVYTLGISEVVAGPLENSISEQDQYIVEVTYNTEKRAEKINYIAVPETE